MKFFKSISIAIILALTITILPVSASPPLILNIVSEMWPNPEDPIAPYTGTFIASGPAVDAGLICSAGDVVDDSNPAVGWQSGVIIKLVVHKHFYCADGSGSFEMNMNVLLFMPASRTSAQWIIVGGDGAYGSLIGNGSLTAEGSESGALIDTYFGRVQ